MRTLLLVLALLFSVSNVFALTQELRIEKTLCGEIDPYILGDACLLYASNKSDVYALVIEIEDFNEFLEGEISEGDLIQLDDKYFSNIDNRNLENLIRNMADEIDSKMKVFEISALKYALGSIIKSQTLNAFRLTCHEINAAQDGMYTNVIIEALVKVKSFDTYEILEPRVRYELTRISNPDVYFTEFDNFNAEYTKLDKRNFTPVRYFNYFKFADLYGKKTRGNIHLLLPKEKFVTSSRRKKFYGFLQMADINGVYGTTVKLSCDILHTTR
tara:strand:+ start:106569 stop:107384 length:816 start_codon:yes stop_codon:yes gene_type:complete